MLGAQSETRKLSCSLPLSETCLDVICTLVPRLANLAAQLAEVDKGEGVLLHVPDDVLLQQGVGRLPYQVQRAPALLQFVIQEGFQEA